MTFPLDKVEKAVFAGKGGSKKSDGKPGSPGTSGSAGKSGSAGQAGQSENISILPYRDPVD